MNGELRIQVQDVVKEIGETVLTFGSNLNWDKDTSNLTLEKLILLVIKNNSQYGTIDVNSPEKVQCRYGASRSATDIWRFIKNSRPDVTIFDVMQTLYKMNIENKISTWKCGTIHRRVFNKFIQPVQYKYNHDAHDEFGIVFADWKEI